MHTNKSFNFREILNNWETENIVYIFEKKIKIHIILIN